MSGGVGEGEGAIDGRTTLMPASSMIPPPGESKNALGSGDGVCVGINVLCSGFGTGVVRVCVWNGFTNMR